MRRLLAVGALALLGVAGVLLARGSVPCELLALQPSCEVALRPGPSEDALALISLDGARAFRPAAGQLRLTTVAVDEDLDFRGWLRSRTSPVDEALPRERIYPRGADLEEVAERNAAAMADSQLVATLVALETLGHDLDPHGARVVSVTSDAVTDQLGAGDVIVAADGREVQESAELVERVRALAPGDELALRLQDGAEVRVTLGEHPDAAGEAYVGVLLTTAVDLPVDVDIDAGAIGGPSAGLMFALSLVELLEEGDLVGDRIVAGTGVLARDGRVGPVGGVRQKLAGATGPGASPPADVFLVPRENLDDARATPVGSDVLVVPVGTLREALSALEELREGRDPSGTVRLAAG